MIAMPSPMLAVKCWRRSKNGARSFLVIVCGSPARPCSPWRHHYRPAASRYHGPREGTSRLSPVTEVGQLALYVGNGEIVDGASAGQHPLRHGLKIVTKVFRNDVEQSPRRLVLDLDPAIRGVEACVYAVEAALDRDEAFAHCLAHGCELLPH